MIKYIFSFSILILFMSCDDILNSKPTTYDIKYKVSGTTNTVSLIYQNKDCGTSQISNASLPWEYSFTGYPDDFLYIAAQNNNSSGSVTVTIWKDGKIFKTTTSSGAYVIATASGSL